MRSSNKVSEVELPTGEIESNEKSINHSRITGDFAEYLVLYRLSRDGNECARIDHVGIDLVARMKSDEQLRGISVKCRSRYEGTERESVTIVASDVEKAIQASERFLKGEAWFAIVVDSPRQTWLYLLSAQHLKQVCPEKNGRHDWKMTTKAVEAYRSDPAIEVYEFGLPVQAGNF